MASTGIFGIILLACAIWVIYDVFANNKKKGMDWKVLWTLLAVVFNIIAAIVYYFMYKR